MGGRANTSTHDVTKKALRSPCSKSKIRRNASAATPTLSGHLVMRLLVIVVRCCSTCLARGTFQTKDMAKRYSVAEYGGLVLVQMAVMS